MELSQHFLNNLKHRYQEINDLGTIKANRVCQKLEKLNHENLCLIASSDINILSDMASDVMLDKAIKNGDIPEDGYRWFYY